MRFLDNILVFSCAIGLILTGADTLAGTNSATTTPADVSQQCATLIARLDNADPNVVETNELDLWRMGPVVRPYLTKAQTHSPPQVMRRATEMLFLLDIGCSFDAPEALFLNALRFRQAKTRDQKRDSLGLLKNQGTPACHVLLGLLRREGDFSTCRMIADALPLDEVLTMLLGQDSLDTSQEEDLETVLETRALFEYKIDDEVAYSVVTAGVKPARENWKQRWVKFADRDKPLAAVPQPQDREEIQLVAKMLIALDRADGDFHAALEVARQAGLADIDDDLERAGEWETRAKQDDYVDLGDASFAVPALLRKSRQWQFAGNEAKAKEFLDKAKQSIKDSKGENNRFGLWLILADQPSDGVSLLKSSNVSVAFTLLKGRLSFEQAIQLKAVDDPAGDASLKSSQEKLRLELGLLQPTTRPTSLPTQQASALEQFWWFDDRGKVDFKNAVQHLRNKEFLIAAKAFDALLHTQTRLNSGGHDPGVLYLRGYCRTHAGLNVQGDADMLHALILPLSHGYVRSKSAAELEYAGLQEDCDHQRSLNLQIGVGSLESRAYSIQSGLTLAVSRNDWKQAIAFSRIFEMQTLAANAIIEDPLSYLLIAWRVHVFQAHLAIEQSDAKAVAHELEICNGIRPDNIELVTKLLPDLERHHQTDSANSLFDSTYQTWDRLTVKYPRSATLHNSAAWLAASCHRRLDDAIRHAQAAVALDNGEWKYFDTLAEAEFHAGDREKAVAAAQHALAFDQKDQFRQERLDYFTNDPLPVHHQ